MAQLPEVDSLKLFGVLVLGAAVAAVLVYIWDRGYIMAASNALYGGTQSGL